MPFDGAFYAKYDIRYLVLMSCSLSIMPAPQVYKIKLLIVHVNKLDV